MRQALVRLEQVTKKELRRKKNQSNSTHNMWDHIVSPAAMGHHANHPASAMAKQAAVKTLKDLDAMIAKQQSDLSSLEQKVKDEIDGKVIND